MIYAGIDKKGIINNLHFLYRLKFIYIGKFLNDVNILNLETLIWETIEIEGDIDG